MTNDGYQMAEKENGHGNYRESTLALNAGAMNAIINLSVFLVIPEPDAPGYFFANHAKFVGVKVIILSRTVAFPAPSV